MPIGGPDRVTLSVHCLVAAVWPPGLPCAEPSVWAAFRHYSLPAGKVLSMRFRKRSVQNGRAS